MDDSDTGLHTLTRCGSISLLLSPIRLAMEARALGLLAELVVEMRLPRLPRFCMGMSWPWLVGVDRGPEHVDAAERKMQYD